VNDPKPEWFPYDGGSYPEYLEKLSAWEKRHPEGYEEPVRPTPAPEVKIELPKSAPVIVAAIAKPAPTPMVRVSVQREPREGHSGYFFKEVFWNLPIDERNGKMMRVNHDAALKNEWDTICETMRAPREAPLTLSESGKTKLFAPPAVLDPTEVFASGQPQTIDEARASYLPTMANSTAAITPPRVASSWQVAAADADTP
jgi:hypothetical protein